MSFKDFTKLDYDFYCILSLHHFFENFVYRFFN